MIDETLPIQESPTPHASEPTPLIRWGWLRALTFLVSIVPLAVIWALISSLIIFATGVDFHSEAESLYHPVGAITNWIMLLTAILWIWLFRRFIDRRSLVSVGFSLKAPYVRHMIQGLLWGIGLIVAIFGLTYALGGISISATQFPVWKLVVMAISLLAAAALEEVLIRGYLLHNLMQSTDRYIALLFTSMLFAVMHGFNDNVGFLALGNIVLAGLLLGVYYIHRQNLWLPIALHFGWNYIQGPVLGSPVSGASTPSLLTLDFTGNDLLTGGEFGFEASLVATVVLIVAILAIHFTYRAKPESNPTL